MVTGIILASGFSKRMGEDKLLIEIDGEKIVETVIKEAKSSKLSNLLVVYRKDEVRKIADAYKVESVLNTRAELGQSESMKRGIKSTDKGSDFMFLMGDQPFINSDLIDTLINEYKKSSRGIIVPFYNSKKGMPSIFSSSYRQELLEVEGDKGGRDVMEKYKEDIKKIYFQDEKSGTDIDTVDDLERIKRWIR